MDSDCYAQRVADGSYDEMYTELQKLGVAALAHAEYNSDFIRQVTPRGNYAYFDTEEHKEFHTILMGEICGSASGTLLCARGNHYPGPNASPVTDSSNVKDVLVLQKPTLSTPELARFFDDQIASLNEIRVSDEADEQTSGQNPIVKEWLKPSTSDPNKPLDLIAVHLGPKYEVPKSSNTSKRITKKRTIEPDSNTETVSSNDNPKDGPSEQSHEVKLGAYYPLDLLPDHRGAFFQQSKARLVQLDLKDIDNNLIAPWKVYDKLRPGTVVLIQATLVCWVIKEKNIEKKIYQVNGHSLRVLAESTEEAEIPGIPILPASHTTPSGSKSPGKSTQAFATFESPSKKRKMVS